MAAAEVAAVMNSTSSRDFTDYAEEDYYVSSESQFGVSDPVPRPHSR